MYANGNAVWNRTCNPLKQKRWTSSSLSLLSNINHSKETISSFDHTLCRRPQLALPVIGHPLLSDHNSVTSFSHPPPKTILRERKRTASICRRKRPSAARWFVIFNSHYIHRLLFGRHCIYTQFTVSPNSTLNIRFHGGRLISSNSSVETHSA